MNFLGALDTLRGGDRVAREAWGRQRRRSLDPADFTATDWYVLPLREWTEETNQRE